MTESIPIPGYEDSLSFFLGDLRTLVFSSQSAIARHLGLSHSTISRYEGGQLTPPVGYLSLLAQLVGERLTGISQEPVQNRGALLQEVNKALHWCYPDQAPFRTWDELCRSADSYDPNQQDFRRTQQAHPGQLFSWGEAPDVADIYGRKADLSQLEKWILQERCQLIAVLGMGGIGKTILVTKLARGIQPEFERVIWRSLRNSPYLEDAMMDILGFLDPQLDITSSSSLDRSVSYLIEYFREHRCLLVFDNLEAIMHSGQHIGFFREGYEPYEAFFRAVANTHHQSCVLITSREKPAVLSQLADPAVSARSYQLMGLSMVDGVQLLQRQQLNGTQENWGLLVAHYSGNPLALILIAETINDLFEGDIAQFLTSESFIFGDVRNLLDQQFNRLSPLALQVMYWLAVEREALSLKALSENLTMPHSGSAMFLEAILSLQRISLIENRAGRFYLQNVVSEYTIDRFINQVYLEILGNRFDILQKVALVKARAKEHVRRSQVRLVLQPIVQLLNGKLGEQGTRLKLEQLLGVLKSYDYQLPGCAAGNIINMLLYLKQDMRDYDFSDLAVWHAYLRDAQLPNVKFVKSDLSQSVFDNAFVGVNVVALSSTAEFLAIASGQDIRLWRLYGRQPYLVFQGHTDLVWGLVFSRDGQYLYSFSTDRTVRRWDVESGRSTLTIQAGDTHQICSIAINSPATLLATGGEEGAIFLWDALTGEVLNTFVGHQGAVRAVSFHPEGRYLVSGSKDKTVRLWRLADGSLDMILEGHEEAITSVACTSDGKTAVSGSVDGTIRLWDIPSRALRAVLVGHEGIVSAVKCCADSVRLISSSYDRTVRIWNIEQEQQTLVFRGHSQSVGSIDLDETGSIVVSGSYDRTVRIWETQTGQILDIIKGLTFELRSLDFSPDGQYLAGGSTDYRIRVWDLSSGQRVHLLSGHKRWVESVNFAPVGFTLASGGYDRTVRLWDLRQGKESHLLQGHNYWIKSVCYRQDGQVLASAGVDQTIRLWDVSTGQLVRNLREHEGCVNCVVFSPRDAILASGSDDRTVRLWNTDTGELIRTLRGYDGAVTNLTFSPDGETLVSGSEFNTIWLWDVKAGKPTDEPFSPDPTARVMAISPSGRMLASYGRDHQVKLWDIQRSHLMHVLTGGPGSISTFTFDSNERQLASGSINGQISIWDVDNGNLRHSLKISQPYDGMDITAATGLSAAQREMLKALGAIED